MAYRVHTVRQGDTIQSVGIIYNVNWTDIVTLNGLELPFIDDSIPSDYKDNDKVAKINDTLLIPSENILIPTKTNNSISELEKHAFGSDLDIYSYQENINGVVNLETHGEFIDDKGDVKLSEGIENLKQQIIIKLGTPKGSLLLHQDFGSRIHEYIGRPATVELLTQIKLEVQECILSDFRVKAISNLNVNFKNGRSLVECMIYPIDPYKPFKISHDFSK